MAALLMAALLALAFKAFATPPGSVQLTTPLATFTDPADAADPTGLLLGRGTTSHTRTRALCCHSLQRLLTSVLLLGRACTPGSHVRPFAHTARMARRVQYRPHHDSCLSVGRLDDR